jgi:hypothetical protein
MVAHDTMQPQALALVVLFPVLSTIFVALRVWIRITMQQFRWGACSELPQSYFFELVLLTCAISTDDGLCVVACVLAVAYAGVVYRWILYQWFGYHVWDIPDYVRAVDNQVFASKLNMAQQLLYNPILGIVKASIILFLLRLGDRRWFIRYGLIAFFIFK